MKKKSANANVKKPKDDVINVRCTSEQKVVLESTASRDGLGVSTWLLQLGLRAARSERASDER